MKRFTYLNPVYFKCLFICLCLFQPACKKDPVNTSIIEGLIKISGVPEPKVLVNLQSRTVHTSATSNTAGKYVFPDLPLGDYRLSVTLNKSDTSGATTTFTGQVDVQINTEGETVTADINLVALPLNTGGGGGGGGGGSCPYIYTFNGESYIFNGDIFAGAIYPSLERHDYSPLFALKNVQGEYKLKLANELQEKQYTNLAELLLIHHPPKVQILFDKSGNIQTLSQMFSPTSALSDNGYDYNSFIKKDDGISYLFDEISDKEPGWFEELTDIFIPQSGKKSLVLSFDRTKNTKQGKLVVQAKNSHWSVALWQEFTSLFGTYYPSWNAEQKLHPAEELIHWRQEEALPIMVYIETEKGWEYLDCYNIVGSVIERDMVMPIDLSKIHTSTFKLKLECAFKFWELDYVAMDFTENAPCTIERIQPTILSLKGDKNKQMLLKNDDALYLEHLKTGDEDILSYRSDATKDTTNVSFFLHSKGYYDPTIENKNEPQYLKLFWFLRPGSFAQFSEERYKEFLKTSAIAKR